MAFDFPATPTDGDVFSSNGINYKWNGYAWMLAPGDPVADPPLQLVQIKRTITPGDPPVGLLPGELAIEMADPTRLWVGVPAQLDLSGKKLLIDTSFATNVVVSETAPPDPVQGAQWLESDTMILWIYYIDPTGAPGQWVQVNGVSTTPESSDPGAGDAYTKAESNTLFVDVAGDTMTGNLTITKTSPSLNLNNTNPLAGTFDGIAFQYIGKNRWWLAGGADPITSGNAGSNFTFYGYDDNDFAWAVYNITRNTKIWTQNVETRFNSTVRAASGANSISTTTGALVVSGGIGASGPCYIGSTSVDDLAGGVSVGSSTTAIAVRYTGAGTVYGITLMPRTGGTSAPLVFLSAYNANVGSVAISDVGTQYNTNSDARVKTDLRSIENSGALIDQTNVYDFAWVLNGERAHGVIAQEAVEVYPQAVSYLEQGDSWGVDYSKYVPILLQEVKNLRARVAELESRYGSS